MDATTSAAAPRREALERRVRWLARATIAYNLAEGAVAIAAGVAAGSIALMSFGGDSLVECLSAVVILWQFRGVPEDRERRALRFIGLAFFALAAYVTVESLRTLATGADADPSPVGIALAAVSLVVMPLLSWLKRRTGRELGSRAVVADSVQTLLCTYLSAALLGGLLLNALWGWSWADPVAALVVAAVAAREGREAWRGEACECD